MANDIPATSEQPVFPAVPWYQSEMQVRAVIAIAAQIVSIIFRTIQRFFPEFHVSSDAFDATVADVTQGVALFFAAWAVLKRQQSAIQPLTMTQKGAEDQAHRAQLDPQTLEKK